MDRVYKCKVKIIKLLEENEEDVFPRWVKSMRQNIENTTQWKQ